MVENGRWVLMNSWNEKSIFVESPNRRTNAKFDFRIVPDFVKSETRPKSVNVRDS